MTFSSCLTEDASALVLDASVVINLLATGHAISILQSFPETPLVTNHVVGEITAGATNGRPESDKLSALLDHGALKVVELNEPALESFFDIVSGLASQSLGDGEAATLAFAHHNGVIAAIDEKKATRIAAERFTSLKIATTVDIFAFDPVRRALGPVLLSRAIFDALRRARMQVWEHQFDWVTQQIGVANLQACPSLTRLAKQKG